MAIRRVSDLPELTSIYPYESINGENCLIETSYSHEKNRYQSFYANANSIISVGLSACGIEVDDIVTRSSEQTISGKKTFTNENGIYIQTNSQNQASNIRYVENDRQGIINAEQNKPWNVPTTYAVKQYTDQKITELEFSIKQYINSAINSIRNDINNAINNLQNQINSIRNDITNIYGIINQQPSEPDESTTVMPDYGNEIVYTLKQGSRTITMPVDAFIAPAKSNGYVADVFFEEQSDAYCDTFGNTGIDVRAGTNISFKSTSTRKLAIYPYLDGYVNNANYTPLASSSNIKDFIQNLINNQANLFAKDSSGQYIFRLYGCDNGLTAPKWTTTKGWDNITGNSHFTYITDLNTTTTYYAFHLIFKLLPGVDILMLRCQKDQNNNRSYMSKVCTSSDSWATKYTYSIRILRKGSFSSGVSLADGSITCSQANFNERAWNA